MTFLNFSFNKMGKILGIMSFTPISSYNYYPFQLPLHKHNNIWAGQLCLKSFQILSSWFWSDLKLFICTMICSPHTTRNCCLSWGNREWKVKKSRYSKDGKWQQEQNKDLKIYCWMPGKLFNNQKLSSNRIILKKCLLIPSNFSSLEWYQILLQ